MLVCRKVTLIGPNEANQKEQGADNHMKPMEARRHVEGGAIDVL